jgi:DNA-binding transcriptional ArsR family regulator
MDKLRAHLRLLPPATGLNEVQLDAVFFALSDPVRRTILVRLDGEDITVGDLAEPFGISLQAVSRHIQVLVAAGLVSQERTGRISRCSLETGPILAATVWLSRYSKYWEAQFEGLKNAVLAADQGPKSKPKRKRKR